MWSLNAFLHKFKRIRAGEAPPRPTEVPVKCDADQSGDQGSMSERKGVSTTSIFIACFQRSRQSDVSADDNRVVCKRQTRNDEGVTDPPSDEQEEFSYLK